jgi:hypothetical protein
MPIFLLPLPVLAMAGILYFIVSGKSAPAVRRVAVIAFILAVFTILVCSFFVLGRGTAPAGPYYSPDGEDPGAPAPPPDIALAAGMILIFIIFVIFIVLAARGEQKRRKNG